MLALRSSITNLYSSLSSSSTMSMDMNVDYRAGARRILLILIQNMYLYLFKTRIKLSAFAIYIAAIWCLEGETLCRILVLKKFRYIF